MALIFTLFSFTGSEGDDHDIHVSVSELRYNASTGYFELSVKIFIDDLERSIAKTGISGLSIGTSSESKSANEAISSYLDKHFHIDLDGQKIRPEFLGKEISDDMLAVWSYIQFKTDARQGQQCRVNNDILLELYEDQKNMLDIRIGPSQKDYVILQSGHTTWSYTF